MVRRYILFLIICLLPITVSGQKIGLVLSGGGAKGVAHIGMIKALEENDIPIDCITGTSMGAIVGSLYAMGYSPDEMLNLILSDEFRRWYSGEPDGTHRYYFKQEDPTPSIATIRFNFSDSLLVARPQNVNIVNPRQMNLGFVDVYSGANAVCEGNFNKLFVPFRSVGSDVYNKKTIVMSSGDLGNAVRASMTFPFVFKPIKMNGVQVYDGGIYDNYPFDVMIEEFNPDFIIGGNVSSPDPIPEDDDLYGQIRTMIIQDSNLDLPADKGISVNTNLTDVKLLNYQRSLDIYNRGYESTINMMDSIKSRISQRRSAEVVRQMRAEFKSRIPSMVFRDIQITGTTPEQADYLEREFRQENGYGSDFDYEGLKSGYFKLLSDNNITEIVPVTMFNKSDSTFTLNMDVKLDDKPSLHIGGALSTAVTSQLYAGISYRHISNYSLDVLLDGQVGRAYNDVQLTARIDVAKRLSRALAIKVAYSNFNYYNQKYIFNNSDNPAFNKNNEFFVKAKISMPFLKESKAEFTVGGAIHNDFYIKGDNHISYFKYDVSRYQMFGGSVSFVANTLNRVQYPTKGHFYSLKGDIVTSREKYLPHGEDNGTITKNQSWLQFSLYADFLSMLSRRFTLGNYFELYYSSRGFSSNYYATMMQAGSFEPTVNSKFIYNNIFRANQYMAYGIKPIFVINSYLHLRGEFYGFLPIYPILCDENMEAYYGKPFSEVSLLGEISLVATYGRISGNIFININGNLHKFDSPTFGVTLGFLMPGGRFLE